VWGEFRRDCIEYLDAALKLDELDPTTRDLVRAIRELKGKPKDQREQFGSIGRSVETRSEDVDRLYGTVSKRPDTAVMTK